jgi:hypothetical protein
MIYVPYCTGDVHGGANPNGMVKGVTGTQLFVGYNNVKLDLDVTKTLVANPTDVLLAGMSGGGFGTVMNYDQVAAAFPSNNVTMIDDSGPPMADPYLAACLQSEVATLWGLDKTVIAACGDDCPADGGPDVDHFAIDVMKHIGKKYPKAVVGVMDSTADKTIGSFFGFGAQNCTMFLPELESDFTAGLLDIRSQMAFDTNFGSFYFKGQDHTSTEGQLDTRTAGGDPDAGMAPVNLYDWIGQMVSGKPSNVGPP